MRKDDLNLYNFLIGNGLLNTPPLNDLAINNWGLNLNNLYEHYNSYILNIEVPNSPGPIEKHPYIDHYQVDCDFQRQTLLLGTFPPSSYFNNLPLNNLPNLNVQNNNPTNYFYGNMNALWYYLFGLIDDEVTIPTIQASLLANDLSISDVFSFVQRRKMISAFDSEYRNIVLNCNLKNIFNRESGINTILFTSGNLGSFLNNTTSTLTGFRWILEDCCDGLNNFSISGDISGNGTYYMINNLGIQNALIQQNNGIVWWLKTGLKKIKIINLPSPAPTASLKMIRSSFFRRWINYKAIPHELPPLGINANVNQFLREFPHIFNAPYTKHYRRDIYQMALNNNINLI
ncbi:MAG: hypothetical protein CFE24_14685 [Flavobacterium sp. BFFFF2]|nr:MAG: hypothetical protein CFE24_14685 [Flavobacterium sp. BFFFF2]